MPSTPQDRRNFLAAGALAAAAALVPNEASAQPAGGRVTSHVLDLYSGKPAAGMRIELQVRAGDAWRVLKDATSDADGRSPGGPLLAGAELATGRYQVVVHVGDYFKQIGAQLPAGYHAKLLLEFEVFDAQRTYHLVFQVTPWTQSASVFPG